MNVRIATLPGDGVGPEVIAEARLVIEAVAQRFGHQVEFVEGLIGGVAIDRTKKPLPDETLANCRGADAVLLGAVGGRQWDNPGASVRPEDGLLGLRKSLELFANLRPVRVFPSLAGAGPLRRSVTRHVDLLVVRELTGGIYFGERGRRPHPSGEEAFDTEIYNTAEIERIVRLAAKAARARRGRLTSIDKANVLETSRLWRETTQRVVGEEFPDIELEHMLVDAAAMQLIRDPSRFDVIVTGNMFGDILTDEASVISGSIGMLPSASVGESGPGMFEPIHGSAPDIAGRGIVNPIGMILSTAMMCRESLGWHDEARCIESAVSQVLKRGTRTVDISRRSETAVSTKQMGAAIVEAIESAKIDMGLEEKPNCDPTPSREGTSERPAVACSKPPGTTATKTSTSPSSPSPTVTWISSRDMLISMPSDNT